MPTYHCLLSAADSSLADTEVQHGQVPQPRRDIPRWLSWYSKRQLQGQVGTARQVATLVTAELSTGFERNSAHNPSCVGVHKLSCTVKPEKFPALNNLLAVVAGLKQTFTDYTLHLLNHSPKSNFVFTPDD